MSEAVLKIERPGLLKAFINSEGASGGWTGAEEEWGEIQRIFDRRVGRVGSRNIIQYLCKWKGLDYEDSTWELLSDLEGKDLVRLWRSGLGFDSL